MWLHKMNDVNPVKTDLVVPKFKKEHTPNLTATPQRYTPYSTTAPKFETWTPKRQESKETPNLLQ